jgi:hypothetical protein
MADSLGSTSRPNAGDSQAAEVKCQFCGKPQDAVQRIVSGPTRSIAIRNECVELRREIMDEELS